jgi:hypothetical protein
MASFFGGDGIKGDYILTTAISCVELVQAQHRKMDLMPNYKIDGDHSWAMYI